MADAVGIEPTYNRLTVCRVTITLRIRIKMAEVEGFEPPMLVPKTRDLTTCLYPYNLCILA